MKLLIEDAVPNLVESAQLTESAAAEKKYYIQGIFAQAELKNRNGRLYPKAVMENAVSVYQKLIEDKRSISELNHPDQPNVNPERASHIIESLTWDGNNVMGKARILTKLPKGQIAQGLIDEGVKLGVSTRGLGSLSERTGARVVQSDFVLTAIDIVFDPSAPDAFVQGLTEGADWVWNAGAKAWVIAEQTKRVVDSSTVRALEERKAILFANFLKSL